MVQVAVVDTAPRGVRTYGNWRRPTSAGLLGLGSMGTNMLLVGLVLVVLVVMTAGLKEALILAAQAGIKAEVHPARLDDVNDVLDKMEYSSLPGRTVLEF